MMRADRETFLCLRLRYTGYAVQRAGGTGWHAPESAFYASGGRSNRLHVDRENDLVVAVRWIDGGRFDELIEGVLAAIEGAR